MFGGLAWSEWRTYAPSDFLMFSPRIYWRLFEQLNQQLWPAAIVVAVMLFVALRRSLPGLAGWVLAAAWALVAWAYHHERFAPIHGAATVYAVAWALQAGAMLLLLRGGSLRRDARGAVLLAGALLLMPLLAPLAGRPWGQAELFGLAPDPTAIATLGLLRLWQPAADSRQHILPALAALPALWCAVSAATLATMGSWQALAPMAALLVWADPVARHRR